MKIGHVSHADLAGGAARAAWRIHQALRNQGVESYMTVNEASAHDWTVDGPTGPTAKFSARFRPHIGAQIMKFQQSTNRALHSPALLPGGLAARLAKREVSVVNLHWINGEMCSIAELGKIDLPIVWTLHDMWPFCGTEHYASNTRWKDGYKRNNRTPNDRGIDIDRWTWARKRHHWKRPIQLVAPSQWLADCARSSALMGSWPVEVIPNPVDLDLWKPRERILARDLFGLPREPKLVLFGAMGGTSDPRKGSDLLLGALDRLAKVGAKLELVIFGQRSPKDPTSLGFPVHYMGHIHDEVALAMLYAAADVFVLPSRQDNLPNTGVEAQASGRPVVAFDIGGLKDIVRHRDTGYLARPFDVDDLAEGISWVLDGEERFQALSTAAASLAAVKYAGTKVAERYVALYGDVLEGKLK